MFNIASKRPPIYDEESVQPMRDELVAVGFNELRTPEEVEQVLLAEDDKTALVMINSVCGCAAAAARPGVSLALQNGIIPDKIFTVFAGQDRDAVDSVRGLMPDEAASSPSVALFKNGKKIYFMPRYQIEGSDAQMIADNLIKVFNEKCTGVGPSVSPEHFQNVQHAKMCGSKIPLYSEKN